jgi:spore maturation protein CgeB
MTARDRNVIILNREGFFDHGLIRELKNRGLEIVPDAWNPDPQLLGRALGCFIWFYEGIRSPVRVWQLSRLLRSHCVPLFAWNQDAPHYLDKAGWRLDLFDRARLLDIYASHTLVDQTRQFAPLRVYFPNAADTGYYNLRGNKAAVFERMRDIGSYTYDVSFFGAMNGEKYKEMEDRMIFFSRLAKELDRQGIRYYFTEAADMTVDDQVRLIQASRINLNYGATCEYKAPIASGLPERCFGIPAAGGFLLCDKRTHAIDHFQFGSNWAQFDGIDDCLVQIESWLDNFSMSRDIAERAYDHISSHHTYRNRAEQLHMLLNDWHEGRLDNTCTA